MTTYVMLSRFAPGSFADSQEFKQMVAEVSVRIRKECPGVNWKVSYATLGRFDVIDIVETDNPKQLEKAAMIIRTLGRSTTETMLATPWDEFLAALH